VNGWLLSADPDARKSKELGVASVHEHAATPALRPRFTLVSAVYNVEKYLPDFIASIESQDFALDRVQVVMVDDGSTDGSARILAEWQARRPALVTVISQANGGIAAARNAGLPHVRGQWVTFADPDDMLAPDYLSEVDAFLGDRRDIGMAATKRTLFQEATGRLVPHPLQQAHFKPRNRIRNLDEQPEFFHEAVNSAFLRTEIVVGEGLRFDERVRPAYEDGHFCVSYLLRLKAPVVAFISTANYTYRKRADKSSTLDNSKTDPNHYTAQLEHGYLDVLQQAHVRRGHVPHWLQTNVLYQLSWYFQDDSNGRCLPSVPHRDIAEEFHQLLSRIATYLDPWVITTFQLRRFDLAWRAVLLHSYRPEPWHSEFAMLGKIDTWHRLVRVTYRYTHQPPAETFFSNGVVVQPVHEKTRSVVHFDRTVMFERIVWLPSGAIRMMLDHVDVEVRLNGPERPRHTLPLAVIRQRLVPRLAAKRREDARAAAKRQPLTLFERLLVWFAGTDLVRRWFGNAWVLMDRIDNANDSGEFLFRYMRAHRRHVNAWFVIRKGTTDHRRLRKDGYKRIVPHGSIRWKLLMLNCRHLVSSHVDQPIIRPAAVTRLAQPRWRFSFLQHGVTKNDISHWLNPKDLDLLFTSTRAEHESIVGENSSYRYTERETRLTGLPRFDQLRAAGQAVRPEDRDLILVAPTWRSWLTTFDPALGRRSTVSAEDFVATEFGINWLGLIGSPRLRALAEEKGLQVAVLLHPDLQALSEHLALPDHVRVLRYEGQDVRTLFARARVLVTDYSSVAFDAAYIDRPIVYFQFDRDRAWSGEHLGRPGYFEYERDGFGPVALTLDEAVPAIVDTIEHGPEPRPEYLTRIAETFPLRDGGCTERVFEAIRQSTRRAPKRAEAPYPVTAPAPELFEVRGSRLSIVRDDPVVPEPRQPARAWPSPPLPEVLDEEGTTTVKQALVLRSLELDNLALGDDEPAAGDEPAADM
jgi:glycosyltransferase involved in cell wall biosynthesis